MLNKNILFIVLLTSIFGHIKSQNSSKPLIELTNEIKRNFEQTKTFSLELAILFIQQSYEVCSAIDKIKPEILSQLGVKCKTCQKKILSCAEFAGNLVGSGNQDKIEIFKKLLLNPEIQTLNKFIAKEANADQIKCVICDKIGIWEELEQKL